MNYLEFLYCPEYEQQIKNAEGILDIYFKNCPERIMNIYVRSNGELRYRNFLHVPANNIHKYVLVASHRNEFVGFVGYGGITKYIEQAARLALYTDLILQGNPYNKYTFTVMNRSNIIPLTAQQVTLMGERDSRSNPPHKMCDLQAHYTLSQWSAM